MGGARRLRRAVMRNSPWCAAGTLFNGMLDQLELISATILRDRKMVSASTQPPSETLTPPTWNVGCSGSPPRAVEYAPGVPGAGANGSPGRGAGGGAGDGVVRTGRR